jgi:hypothetical protein
VEPYTAQPGNADPGAVRDRSKADAVAPRPDLERDTSRHGGDLLIGSAHEVIVVGTDCDGPGLLHADLFLFW